MSNKSNKHRISLKHRLFPITTIVVAIILVLAIILLVQHLTQKESSNEPAKPKTLQELTYGTEGEYSYLFDLPYDKKITFVSADGWYPANYVHFETGDRRYLQLKNDKICAEMVVQYVLKDDIAGFMRNRIFDFYGVDHYGEDRPDNALADKYISNGLPVQQVNISLPKLKGIGDIKVFQSKLNWRSFPNARQDMDDTYLPFVTCIVKMEDGDCFVIDIASYYLDMTLNPFEYVIKEQFNQNFNEEMDNTLPELYDGSNNDWYSCESNMQRIKEAEKMFENGYRKALWHFYAGDVTEQYLPVVQECVLPASEFEVSDYTISTEETAEEATTEINGVKIYYKPFESVDRISYAESLNKIYNQLTTTLSFKLSDLKTGEYVKSTTAGSEESLCCVSSEGIRILDKSEDTIPIGDLDGEFSYSAEFTVDLIAIYIDEADDIATFVFRNKMPKPMEVGKYVEHNNYGQYQYYKTENGAGVTYRTDYDLSYDITNLFSTEGDSDVEEFFGR